MSYTFLKTSIILFAILYLSGGKREVVYDVEQNQVDIVRDSTTAIKIAEVIFVAHYGEFIMAQKPFDVQLLGDTLWVVSGIRPKRTPGGVAQIKIQKKDGKVIKLSLGK